MNALAYHDRPGTMYVNSKPGLDRVNQFLCEGSFDCLAIDIETTGLDPFADKIVLLQLCTGNEVFVINLDALGNTEDLSLFRDCFGRIFENKNICKLLHNAKFDLKFIQHHLFPTRRLKIENLFDTYIAERVLTAGIGKKGDYTLTSVVEKYTGNVLDKSLQTSFRRAKHDT